MVHCLSLKMVNKLKQSAQWRLLQVAPTACVIPRCTLVTPLAKLVQYLVKRGSIKLHGIIKCSVLLYNRMMLLTGLRYQILAVENVLHIGILCFSFYDAG